MKTEPQASITLESAEPATHLSKLEAVTLTPAKPYFISSSKIHGANAMFEFPHQASL